MVIVATAVVTVVVEVIAFEWTIRVLTSQETSVAARAPHPKTESKVESPRGVASAVGENITTAMVEASCWE